MKSDRGEVMWDHVTGHHHLKFKVALITRATARGEQPDYHATELFDAMSQLEAAVDEVARLARARLAELETPPSKAD